MNEYSAHKCFGFYGDIAEKMVAELSQKTGMNKSCIPLDALVHKVLNLWNHFNGNNESKEPSLKNCSK